MRHRVLYISYSGDLGGAEISLYNLVKRLDKSRFDPVVVCPESGDLVKKLRSDEINVSISPLLPWRKFKSLPFRKAALDHLVNLAQTHLISLIHCNTVWANPYAQRVGKIVGIPVICHLRDIIRPQQVKKYELHQVDLIIPVSKAVEKPLKDFGLAESKVRCVYNGVDTDEFAPSQRLRSELRSEFDLKGVVVAIASQLSPRSGWKGHHDFLYAAAEVVKSKPNSGLKFLIVGGDKSGSYLLRLKDLVSSLNLLSQVIFTGFRDDMPKVMNGIDILVSASLAEPFGRTLIEAMSCAKPVVATNSGGAPEIVKEGFSGYLTKPNDPPSLAQVILRMLDDPDLTEMLGRNGRQIAVEKFSLSENVRQTEAIYDQFLFSKMC